MLDAVQEHSPASLERLTTLRHLDRVLRLQALPCICQSEHHSTPDRGDLQRGSAPSCHTSSSFPVAKPVVSRIAAEVMSGRRHCAVMFECLLPAVANYNSWVWSFPMPCQWDMRPWTTLSRQHISKLTKCSRSLCCSFHHDK